MAYFRRFLQYLFGHIEKNPLKYCRVYPALGYDSNLATPTVTSGWQADRRDTPVEGLAYEWFFVIIALLVPRRAHNMKKKC
jgi:hypothetical protein